MVGWCGDLWTNRLVCLRILQILMVSSVLHWFMAISWEIPPVCTNPQEIHNKHQETMTYKILWYKKAVYHISYDIVFVIFWFTRNWTTQTQDHMNFGKSIPMVVDFATSLALYISLSCWRHNRFALNHWKLATRCYQFPEHQETMPSASPQTPPSHWLDGDIKGTLALVKTRLWFGFKSQLWILWLVIHLTCESDMIKRMSLVKICK